MIGGVFPLNQSITAGYLLFNIAVITPNSVAEPLSLLATITDKLKCDFVVTDHTCFAQLSIATVLHPTVVIAKRDLNKVYTHIFVFIGTVSLIFQVKLVHEIAEDLSLSTLYGIPG